MPLWCSVRLPVWRPAADARSWVQLKNLLAKKIEEGILEPGDDVAVTLEAQEFGVTPSTAQKAFRALVAEGKLIPPP